MTPNRAKWVAVPLALLIAIFAVYFPVILHSHLSNFDDPVVVAPMAHVQSLGDYFELHKKYVILDLEPVRDVSFWLDYQMAKLLGVEPFHAVNALIWFGCLLGLFSILQASGTGLTGSVLILLYCAVHPVAVNSVAWISARKHLLAAFFIIWATFLQLAAFESSGGTRIRLRILSVILFALACLSHPIAALWPAWVFYESRRRREKSFPFSLLALSALAASTLAANFYYYSSVGFAAKVLGANKMRAESLKLLAARFLALGRYFFQLVIPTSPSVFAYDPWNWRNGAGLALLAGFMYFVYRRERTAAVFRWLIFMGLPLAIVTIRPSNVIATDTYLLIPLLGWGCLLSEIRYSPQFRKLVPLFAVVILFLGYGSLSQVRDWTNDEKLWQDVSAREPTSTNLIFYAKSLVNKPDPDSLRKAFGIAAGVFEKDPEQSDLPYVLAKSIYASPDLTPSQKEERFEKYRMPSPWYYYYWAALNASRGDFKKANDLLTEIWTSSPDTFVRAFSGQLETVSAKWFAMCLKARGKTCIQIPREIQARSASWDPRVFNETIKAMGLHAL